MAQLVLAAAGAYVGSFFGSPAIGWAIGSAIGGQLFGDKHPSDADKSKSLIDLRVFGTEYGQPIPYLIGAASIAGQVWWNTDRRATTTESEAEGGGKGGAPSQTVSTTTYDMDLLIGLTDNQILGVRRIWDNGKLIWTKADDASAASLAASATTDTWDRLTVYTGAADQLPDPTYEAAVGSANACAYRGRGTVFIQGLKLGTSGALRNLTFEVVVDGGAGDIPSPRYEYIGAAAPVGAFTYALGLTDPDTGYVWSASLEAPFASAFTVNVNDDPTTQTSIFAFSDAEVNITVSAIIRVPVAAGVATNEVWVLGNKFVSQDYASIYDADSPAHIGNFDLGYRGTARLAAAFYNPTTRKVVTIGFNGYCTVIDPITRTAESTFTLGSIGVAFFTQVIVTDIYFIVFYNGSFEELQIRSLADYSLVRTVSNPYPGAAINPCATYDPLRNKLVLCDPYNGTSPSFNVIDIATGAITTTAFSFATGDAVDTSPWPSSAMRTVVWSPYNDRYIFVCASGTSIPHPNIGTTLNIVNPDTLITERTATYEDYDSGNPHLIFGIALTPADEDAPYILLFDTNEAKRYYLPLDTIEVLCPTVAEAVTRLCVRAGLDTGQIDVTDLSSITRHVCCLPVAQVVGMRIPIELLMSVFFFEMTVSDKIYFIVRGGAPKVTIPFADLGAMEGSDGGSRPEALPLKVLNDIELPAQVAVTYTNIDNDYQTDTQYSDRLESAVPNTLRLVSLQMGLTPSEAKSVADAMSLDEAASCISTQIALLGSYSKYEPTDVVTIIDHDGSSFRFRLVKRADTYPLLKYEAVLDEPSALISQGITSTDYESSTEIAIPSDVTMELLDVPIGQDVDNNAGFYVAAKGDGGDAYLGAAIFSSPDGTTYARKATITENAVMGETVNILNDWTGPRVFDEVSTVRVDVGSGTLSSSTNALLLLSTATNAMLIGSEVIQFRDATLVSDGVYDLTGLLRGGRGTEWAMTGHVVRERAVLIRGAGIRRIILDNSDLGIPFYYKGVAIGRSLSSADAELFTNNAIGLKPFSPVDARADRDGSNNVTFTWRRRSRLSVRMTGPLGISVPLGEDTEEYTVEIYSVGSPQTLLRTITATSETADYSAADQVTDGLTPGDPITIIIRQISSTIGAGYPLEAVV